MLEELDKPKMSGDSKLQVYITISFYYSNFPARQITSQINFPGRVADLVCPGVPVHLALLLASRFLLPAPTPMGDVLRPQVRSSVSSFSSSPLSPPSLPTGGSSRSPHHLRPYRYSQPSIYLFGWFGILITIDISVGHEELCDGMNWCFPISTCLFLIDSTL